MGAKPVAHRFYPARDAASNYYNWCNWPLDRSQHALQRGTVVLTLCIVKQQTVQETGIVKQSWLRKQPRCWFPTQNADQGYIELYLYDYTTEKVVTSLIKQAWLRK
jgi:hypothetical protein